MIAFQYIVKKMNILDAEILKSAQTEVKALCSLDHVNIVKYKEWIQESRHFFIIMEYCDGGDLAMKIKKQGTTKFPENKVIQWTIELCLALQVNRNMALSITNSTRRLDTSK